ncbi:hypothetical protein PGB90_001331 [Kerria lacca]
MCKNKADIISFAKNYTDNLERVKVMLKENYPVIEDRSTKIRFKKIINKLEQSLS